MVLQWLQWQKVRAPSTQCCTRYGRETENKRVRAHNFEQMQPTAGHDSTRHTKCSSPCRTFNDSHQRTEGEKGEEEGEIERERERELT